MLAAGTSQMLSAERLAAPVPHGAHALLAPSARAQHCFQHSTTGRAGFRFAQRYAPAAHAAAADRCGRHIARAVATQQVVETTATTPTSERRPAFRALRRMRRGAGGAANASRERGIFAAPRARPRRGPAAPSPARPAARRRPAHPLGRVALVARPLAAPRPAPSLHIVSCAPPTHPPPPPHHPPPPPQRSPRTWW
jgi:hypothetical protein